MEKAGYRRIKYAIIGTVGLPANYGGFETLTEYLVRELGQQVEITVYCSAKAYTEQAKVYRKAKLKYLPLQANGAQSIPYDIWSLFSAARAHDTILVLGVSGCICLPLFHLLYPKKKLIINIDGLEHRRDKWSKWIRKFLKFSERLAVKYADKVVTDNVAIQDYVQQEYGLQSTMIAYGGDHVQACPLSADVRSRYQLPEKYSFKVCRIEPENNVHLILEAFASQEKPLVVIGNWQNSEYGRNLFMDYSHRTNIILLDPIYDQNTLDQIRGNCAMYIHGHSAGGTNPSLVEAMNLGLPILAYDIDYNRETTHGKAIYFSSVADLQGMISQLGANDLRTCALSMRGIAEKEYRWKIIAEKYLDILKS